MTDAPKSSKQRCDNGHTTLQEWCVYCLAAEIERLRAELETERMRLAGCGVAAMADTPETAAQRLTRDSPYWSASYGDVCRMVDRLMELRTALEGLVTFRDNKEKWDALTDYGVKIALDAAFERGREALRGADETTSVIPEKDNG